MIYKNYINGTWSEKISERGKETFDNVNPADTTKVIGQFQNSCEFCIDDAVESASEAFKTWKNVPAPKRAEILFKAAEILVRDKECIAKGMTLEMGKILAETRGDVQEAIDIAYYAAGAGRRLTGETVPSELENKWSMSVRLPYGVIGMITPWNFPIAIPAWKAFPAIVAGNTVVLKPAEDTPWSVIKLAEVFHEAGLPKGVFNVVTGFGPTAGMPLVKHPKVKVISFTGSSATGHLIAKECSKLGKKYSLELGGKNSITVTKNADLDLAVEGVIFGAFGTTGQRCTACSRVIIDKKVKNEFTEKLVARTESLIIGSGLEDDVDVGPLINEKALDKVERYVTSALASGDYLLIGGHKIKMNSGWFYAPTIFTDITPDNALAQEEIFGPVVAIIEYETFDEMMNIVNGTRYGLSAAIYTKDINESFKFMRDVETGLAYVNTSCIGAEVGQNFGGIKDTSPISSREAGSQMFDAVTYVKNMVVDFSGKLQKAQIETISK
jgi:acyl-CoA reductase-like NAD-dependent aldehyde dehydrogenase